MAEGYWGEGPTTPVDAGRAEEIDPAAIRLVIRWAREHKRITPMGVIEKAVDHLVKANLITSSAIRSPNGGVVLRLTTTGKRLSDTHEADRDERIKEKNADLIADDPFQDVPMPRPNPYLDGAMF